MVSLDWLKVHVCLFLPLNKSANPICDSIVGTNLFMVFTHHNQYQDEVYRQYESRDWIKGSLK